MWEKRGQVAIFVVIAIVIVGAVVAFLAVRGNFSLGVPAELAPVFTTYQGCIERETRDAIDLLGSHGGYIDTGAYMPGNDIAPFSSHLGFLGLQIPYWFSLNGERVVENVPSLQSMEEEISNFVALRVNECDFSPFYAQGFYVELGEPSVSTQINEGDVRVDVRSRLSVSREEISASKSEHNAVVQSKIGTFYDIARGIYDKEKSEAFLDNYAADVLRLYAPVDGVDVQCSPSIWKTREVVEELKDGLQANFAEIKFENSEDYFAVEHIVSEQTRVIYSKDWPSMIEITPAEEDLMVAEPIGNQEGLGVLGFCYVPYHFVYDISFPALIQIGNEEELFQFPVVVIVDNNLPRNSLGVNVEAEVENDICAFKAGEARISTYDSSLNPIEAEVSYQCFEQTCSLGRTELDGNEAVLEASLPICVNGYLIAKADNFSDSRELFSSNSETSKDLVLQRSYPVKVEVLVDGQPSSGNVIVHFAGKETESIILPERDTISLSEGSYNVSVYVYGNSSVTIPASTRKECTEVARGGVLGFFGQTKEECFDIEIPETRIEHALRGGGMSETYILASELESGKISVFVPSLPIPTSLEQLQYNFELFESMEVDLGFA